MMFSRRYLSFQLFTIAFLLAMFLPRVLPEGMFSDALTYTSIARNMAIGKGAFWTPYFSRDFWLPFQGEVYQFYGHPPLVMGIMSFFFKFFGEHWFIEKAYSILVWVITIFCIKQIWQIKAADRALWWLPLLVWYTMPTVLWCYPFAMLDNSMAIFSFLASILIIKSLSKKENIYLNLTLAGLLLHLAFLSKGPVGIYPLAMPFIYGFFYRKDYELKQSLMQTGWISLVFFGTFSLWFLYQPAAHFLKNYFYTQLGSSIGENDQTEVFTWLNYFDTIFYLLQETAPIWAFILVIWIFAKIKKAPFYFNQNNFTLSKFYFVVGLSGSLPMSVSHKISAFYLVPSLPFFALAFAAFFENTLSIWAEKYRLSPSKMRFWNGFMAITLVGTIIYSATKYATLWRDEDIINDTKVLTKYLPKGGTFGVFGSTLRDFTVHCYFQRYEHWELSRSIDTPQYFLVNRTIPTENDSIPKIEKYQEVKNDSLQRFRLFEKK